MPTSDECKNTSDELYGYIAKLLADQPFFKNLVGGLKAGNIEVSMFRKLVNKKIEEEWIDAIEACILPLDNVIRRPSRYIEELDEVKPIELSRNITSRSIQHLAQHTDYISEVKGDEITPSKILNVFHEETMLTYENRFVNTLIRQLYLFVNKRYNEMVKNGAENSTSFDISAQFKDGTLVSSVRFGLTVSESAEGAAEADPLLKRVMRLNSVVTMYYNSPFAKSMNGAYVRPPIMRTNALMKNRDLRQCLELWQFIEGYEKVGYSISVEQMAEKPDRALIERLYADLALQYTVFRREIAKAADTLAEEPGVPFQPLFVAAIQPVEQKKFNLNDCVYRKVTPVSYVNPPRKLSRDELKIRAAVDEALGLDALMKKHDLIEEAKRRAMEEGRRLAAEKAREEARLKAEEDARAVAEYYASLGYRVRMKSRFADSGEIEFEPTNAAQSLSEAVETLEGALTGGAEAVADAKADGGLLLSDEEIAARTSDGDMLALEELFGSRYLKADRANLAGEKVALRRKAAKGRGFVIARMIPAGNTVGELPARESAKAEEIAAADSFGNASGGREPENALFDVGQEMLSAAETDGAAMQKTPALEEMQENCGDAPQTGVNFQEEASPAEIKQDEDFAETSEKVEAIREERDDFGNGQESAFPVSKDSKEIREEETEALKRERETLVGVVQENGAREEESRPCEDPREFFDASSDGSEAEQREEGPVLVGAEGTAVSEENGQEKEPCSPMDASENAEKSERQSEGAEIFAADSDGKKSQAAIVEATEPFAEEAESESPLNQTAEVGYSVENAALLSGVNDGENSAGDTIAEEVPDVFAEEAEEPWSEFFEEAAPAGERQTGEEAAPFTVREGEAERAAASESSFQAGQETEGLEGTDEAAQEDGEKEESQIREEFEEREAFVDSKETSMSERTEDAEARREELALAVTAGMNEEEKKIFEDETLGLTLEEKLAYRKMSRGKRRVLKKIAETRRRKAELRLENERRAVAAMEKLEKLRESARSHENYKNENGARPNGSPASENRSGRKKK